MIQPPSLILVEKARIIPPLASRRRLEARVRGMAKPLEAWFRRFAEEEARLAMRDPVGYAAGRERARKARGGDTDELRRLLLMFGLREAADAASRTSGAVLVPESLVSAAIANKDVRIKWFWELQQNAVRRATDIAEATKDAARERVRRILADAQAEETNPGAAEVARRISNAFLGPGEAARQRQVVATEGEREFAFSPERAAIIARTELNQAENAGIFAGYEATGVEEIEWLAYRDGRSGSRHHERMHGERVKLGEFFTLPSGARMRYPGDPMGPVGDLVNCRCTSRAVRQSKKPKAPRPAPATTAMIETAPTPLRAAPRATPAPVQETTPRQAEIEVESSAMDAARSIVGRGVTPEQIAALTGLADARVTIDYDDRNESMFIVATRAYGDEKGVARRQLYRDRGDLVMYNEGFFLPKEGQGAGAGSRAFAQQVEFAAALGVDEIRTEAARGPNLNGYYTWARLGYDAELPEWAQRETGLRMISELMSTPEGRAWWKEKGQTFKGVFDLRPGSASRRALDAYLRDRFGKARQIERAPALDRNEEALDAAWDRLGAERGVPPPVSMLDAAGVERELRVMRLGRRNQASEAWRAALRAAADRAGLR